jgi:dienelactone hydrolase
MGHEWGRAVWGRTRAGALGALAVLASFPAASFSDPVPVYEDPPPAYAWEGDWQSQNVTFPSRATHATLTGVLFAPKVLPAHVVPVVVITPGSGPGKQSDYQWAARDLAGHGYVTLTVDPQGVGGSAPFGDPPCTTSGCPGVPFQQADNYTDATESGIDFVLSPANPWRAITDDQHVGAAGHSLSARAVSYLQGVDPRIKAIVAWDNLASDLAGDDGSPSGGGAQGAVLGGELPGASEPVTPRVPAMGQASESGGAPSPQGVDPEVKKTAFSAWQKKGIPSMELVFAGAAHADWAQGAASAVKSKESSLKNFEYFTRAWFDLFLRHDVTAVPRLFAPVVDGVARQDLLSSEYRSAAFLPDQAVSCPDLVHCVVALSEGSAPADAPPGAAPADVESVHSGAPPSAPTSSPSVPAPKSSSGSRRPACDGPGRLVIRLRRPGGLALHRVTIAIKNRVVARLSGRQIRSRVVLAGLPKRPFSVRIRVTTARGTRTVTRRYHACGSGS